MPPSGPETVQDTASFDLVTRNARVSLIAENFLVDTRESLMKTADVGGTTNRTIRRQQRVWSSRVDSWTNQASAGLKRVTDAVVTAARVQPGESVVDIGAGTGQLSFPLAELGARVLAIDISPAMVERLEVEAVSRDVEGLEVRAQPIESVVLPALSVDVVVSSYALHHLRDRDKTRVVDQAFGWLRPGGRLVIADMMFGRGGSQGDRALIASKVKALARKGPRGWWRIAKNAARFTLRFHERPISLDAWRELLHGAGFELEASGMIVSEAGLVVGRRPNA